MKTILNWRWLVFPILMVFLVISWWDTAIESILLTVVFVTLLFVAMLQRPVWMVFDEMGLTIHFMFGRYQRLEWNTVWKVERVCRPRDSAYYRLYGDASGKEAFFTDTILPCGPRIRKLLCAYWGGTITE